MIEEAAAAFLLLFESEVVPADMAPPPPSLGSARLDGGGAQVNVTVWPSSQDSLLGGRQATNQAGTDVFHTHAVLLDRRRAGVAWQGDAHYVLHGPGTARLPPD